MLMAKNYRELGQEVACRSMLNELLVSSTDRLASGARQELAVLDQRQRELKWLVPARRTSEPPRLDGLLDEHAWQAASSMRLMPLEVDDAVPSGVDRAYDD